MFLCSQTDLLRSFFSFVYKRIPTDDRHDLWCRAISSDTDPPYIGLICDKHFCADDFSNGKVLRRDAVPKISHGDANQDISDDHQIEPNIQIDQEESSEPIEVVLSRYQQFMTEKAEWNVMEENLKQQISKLKYKAGEQQKHIRFLSLKLDREKNSSHSLNKLLQDLHAEKLLDKGNLEALQVIMMHFYSHKSEKYVT